jgi:hypothetical protein
MAEIDSTLTYSSKEATARHMYKVPQCQSEDTAVLFKDIILTTNI